jgi:hypothetical protein
MSSLPEGPGLYSVKEDSAWAQQKSVRMMQDAAMRDVQLVDFRGDANVDRPVDYWIHVFNIGRQSFTVGRPPCFPVVQIPACPEGKPFVEVLRISNVVNEKWIDAGAGEIRVHGIRGERFAMDLINPANPGESMWQEIETSWIDQGGNDLSRRGVFWTKNAEPLEEEIRRARVWMERHYRALLERADLQARQNRTQDISGEAHVAAEYFHIQSSWHNIARVPEECPNCGESIKTGLAYHVNGTGMLCVIDWKRAVEAGVKTRSDVPEAKRWWVAPATPAQPEPDGLSEVSQSEAEFQASTEA